MKPVLFAPTAAEFATNGLGRPEFLSCIVSETLNGSYDLYAVIAMTGALASEITDRSIIYAKPSPERDPQPFRVYRQVKSIGGLITIYAHHISYDLSGVVLQPFDAESVGAALDKCTSRASTLCPFTFWTDKTDAGDISVEVPSSVRAVLGGSDSSVLGIYGGEFEWDCYAVKLHSQRGTDRGVVLRYGKNLTSFEQDANCAAVYTGIYPYYKDSSGNYTEVDGQVVYASGTYDFTNILAVDLTDQFTELDEGETPSKDTELAYGKSPTPAQLLAVAKQYLEDNDIGIPEVSITVSFAQLEQSEEYKDLALLERVCLGDTVTVIFPEMNVSAKAEVIATEYNVLSDKYTSVSIGDAKQDYVSSQLESQKQNQLAIEQSSNEAKSALKKAKSELKEAQERATKLITGNLGGYVVLHDGDADGYPDEILIMDTADINTAKKVWRWNKEGLGYSSTGYNGTFGLAMTAAGEICADYIKTGSLNASLIKGGFISADMISGGTLDGSKANITNINASEITSGTIKASLITGTDKGTGCISGKGVGLDLYSGVLTIDKLLYLFGSYGHYDGFGSGADNSVWVYDASINDYRRGYSASDPPSGSDSVKYINGICVSTLKKDVLSYYSS